MRFALVFLAVLLTGCGTIMNGTTQKVTFDTEPGGGYLKLYENALYHITPIYEGPLPATIELPRKRILKYDVSRDGFETMTVKMKPKMSGWEAVSDIVPVFASVDTLTGGGRKFEDTVIIPMKPVTNTAAQ